ncbi:MAG: hypothetical protein WC028_08325 [Candidatus Obscuribacterales bacterium]
MNKERTRKSTTGPVKGYLLPRIIETKLISILVLLSLSASPGNAEATAPSTMKKFEVRYVADDIEPSSFGAQPRTCYRAGDSYGRVEEAPDQPLGLHGLIIIAAPDVWIINLFDSSGKHIVYKTSPIHARMPILASGQKAFNDLEFGKELQFFTAKNISAAEGPEIDGAKTRSYKYSESSIDTELLINSDSEPLRLTISTPQGKRTLVYSSYKTLPFDPNKFKQPSDISFSEINYDDVKATSGKVVMGLPGLKGGEKEESGESEEDDSDSDNTAPKIESKKSDKKDSHYGSDSNDGSMREPKTALAALRNSKDLWQWMTYYYLSPVPDLTPAAMHLLEEEDAFDRENALPPISSFFSRVFLQNPEKIQQWINQSQITDEHKKEVLPLVLRLTRLPAAIAEAEAIEKSIPNADRVVTHLDLSPDKLDTFYISSASDLDMLWGCFLATGDRRYVAKIITTVPWSKKLTGSINKISIGAAAVWSLISNAQQHKLVLQILKEESAAKPELQYDLNKIIEKAEKAL